MLIKRVKVIGCAISDFAYFILLQMDQVASRSLERLSHAKGVLKGTPANDLSVRARRPRLPHAEAKWMLYDISDTEMFHETSLEHLVWYAIV